MVLYPHAVGSVNVSVACYRMVPWQLTFPDFMAFFMKAALPVMLPVSRQVLRGRISKLGRASPVWEWVAGTAGGRLGPGA